MQLETSGSVVLGPRWSRCEKNLAKPEKSEKCWKDRIKWKLQKSQILILSSQKFYKCLNWKDLWTINSSIFSSRTFKHQINNLKDNLKIDYITVTSWLIQVANTYVSCSLPNHIRDQIFQNVSNKKSGFLWENVWSWHWKL